MLQLDAVLDAIGEFQSESFEEFAKGGRRGGKKGGGKNCKKQKCGASCISLEKTCRKGMSPVAQKAANATKAKAAAAKSKKSTGGGSATEDQPTAPTNLRSEDAIRKDIEAGDHNISRNNLADGSTVKPNGMTDLEAGAVVSYSLSGYDPLNTLLRGGKIRDDDPKFLASLKEHEILLNSALDKLPAYNGAVYRSAALPNDLLSQYTKGKTIKELGFTSTTSNVEVTSNFKEAGSATRTPVLFVINSRKGRSVESMSALPEEKEVIFKSKTNFKVLGIVDTPKENEMIKTIYLDEVL